MAELTTELNRMAGTVGLTDVAAGNAWAGTTNRELVGALNARNGTTGLGLAGVLNALAGTTGRGINASLTNMASGLALGGTAGNYISTPDSVANSTTGDLDLRVKMRLTDWTPAAQISLIDKTSGGTDSYTFGLNTNGTPFVGWSTDGVAMTFQTGSAANGVTDGTTKWLRVTIDLDNGASNREVKFWLSDNGTTWTQLGTTSTGAVIPGIFDGTAEIRIGQLLAGQLLYAEIRNGIDGAVVQSFNPNQVVKTGTRLPAAVAAGGPWTVTGSAWDWDQFAAPVTVNTLSLPALDNNHATTPDTAAISITGDIDMRIKLSVPNWGAMPANSTLCAKRNTLGQFSWRWELMPSQEVALVLSSDGSSSEFGGTGRTLTGVVNGQPKWLRATWSQSGGVMRHYVSDDGVAWTQLGSAPPAPGSGIFNGTAPLSVGAYSDGVGPLGATVYYFELRNGIDGTVVAKFDPSTVTKLGTRNPTSLVASTGETWTINGSAWDWAAV